MTAMLLRKLHKVDYVSGYVEMMQFTCGDEAPYFVVRVLQYCDNLEYINVSSRAEAGSTFLRIRGEYKEKLSQGRPTIEFQLAEREDGLWEFQSDAPMDFCTIESRRAKRSDLVRKSFKNRDEAIEFGRTCRGGWNTSIHGDYNIVDKSGQVMTA